MKTFFQGLEKIPRIFLRLENGRESEKPLWGRPGDVPLIPLINWLAEIFL